MMQNKHPPAVPFITFQQKTYTQFMVINVLMFAPFKLI